MMKRIRAMQAISLLLAVGVIALGSFTPAAAEQGATTLAVGATVLGVVAVPLMAYGIWRNLPANQGEQDPLPLEFYVAGYLGGTIINNGTYSFNSIRSYPQGVSGAAVNINKISYAPAVVGGLKYGAFLKSYPWFGLETETNFSRTNLNQQSITLSRPIGGSTAAVQPHARLSIWTMALHLMFRYGFLPDQEVPFGRLQPYVGIGPGLVILYGEDDSAKNFALDVQAGVRYMMLKNVSAFIEYKFSHQWDVELEQHTFATAAGLQKGTANFDFDSHRIVLGVAYHF